MNIILGAAEQRWDGWTPTQQDQLNLTRPDSFAAYFGDSRADAFLCKHVWEHLHPSDALTAAQLVLEYLKPGGFLRVAVPDGHHPDPAYQALVAVHGPGPAADHQVLYTLEHLTELRPSGNSTPSASILPNAPLNFARSARPTDGEMHAIFMANALDTFCRVFEQAGFRVRPLEWWDDQHQFHHVDWNADEAPVYRSSRLDHRNAAWREGHGPLGFTSLILDAVNPA